MDFCDEAKYICQNYEKSVTNLLTKINEASSLLEVRKYFTAFYHKYTMLPSLWNYWLELECDHTFPDLDALTSYEQIEKIKVVAKKHFFHNNFDDNKNEWMNGYLNDHLFCAVDLDKVVKYSIKNPTNMEPLKEALTFPHFSIKETKYNYELYGTEPMSNTILQKYQRSQRIVDLFQSEEGIRKEWFEEVMKSLDKNYIIKSFEYGLGKWPHYHDAWKMYISYLEKINSKTLMLTVYSKYCRLFIHDNEMCNNYIKKVEEINALPENVSKWWIDIIETQRIYESNSSAKKILTTILKLNSHPNDDEFIRYVQWFKNCKNKKLMPFIYYLPEREELELETMVQNEKNNKNIFFIKPQQQPSPFYFTEDNIIQKQCFSLPYNYINYLRLTAPPQSLQNLFQTCKYFFHKCKTPFCHRLGVFENSEATYFSQSLFLNAETINFAGLKNLTVTNLLQVHFNHANNIASLLLSIVKCENLSNLELHKQTLSENELNLISGKKIKTVTLSRVTIIDSDENVIEIGKIIEKFPSACSMRIYSQSKKFESNFAENLANLKRDKNLVYFLLSHAPATLNENFYIFLKKFSLPYAQIRVRFTRAMNQDQVDAFTALENEMLKGTRIWLEIF